MKLDLHRRQLGPYELIFIIIFAVIVAACVVKYYCYVIGENEKDDFNAVHDSISYTDTDYQSQVDMIEPFVDDSWLDEYDRAVAASIVASLYNINNENDLSMEYSCKAIYFFSDSGYGLDAEMEKMEMAVTMMDNGAWKRAAEWLKASITACEEYSDDPEYNYALTVAYEDLAEADLYGRDPAAALDHIEMAMKYSEDDGEDADEDLANELDLMKAQAYLMNGQAEEAEELFEGLKAPDTTYYSGFDVINYIMPYTDVTAKLKLYRGDLAGATDAVNVYRSYAVRYGYSTQEDDFISSFLDVAEDCGYDTGSDTFAKYSEILLENYRSQISRQTSNVAQSMSDAYLASIESIENQRQASSMRKIVVGTLLLAVFIVVLSSVLIGRSLRKAKKDGLTGIGNRRSFDLAYGHAVTSKKPFCLIMLDIDDFKKCNDTYGHEFGDRVLRDVAKAIQNSLEDHGEVYRYGGEEFCAIIHTDYSGYAAHIAERIRKNVEALEFENGHKVTISSGIAVGSDNTEVVSRADENLYNSKKNGKNCVSFEGEVLMQEKEGH